MEFARCDGTDLSSALRGNKDRRGERNDSKDLHDTIIINNDLTSVDKINPGGVVFC